MQHPARVRPSPWRNQSAPNRAHDPGASGRRLRHACPLICTWNLRLLRRTSVSRSVPLSPSRWLTRAASPSPTTSRKSFAELSIDATRRSCLSPGPVKAKNLRCLQATGGSSKNLRLSPISQPDESPSFTRVPYRKGGHLYVHQKELLVSVPEQTRSIPKQLQNDLNNFSHNALGAAAGGVKR